MTIKVFDGKLVAREDCALRASALECGALHRSRLGIENVIPNISGVRNIASSHALSLLKTFVANSKAVQITALQSASAQATNVKPPCTQCSSVKITPKTLIVMN